MKYLPKKTCEYLASLGCTSESGYYYWRVKGEEWATSQGRRPIYSWIKDWYPAFSLEDILRKENAEKIWLPIDVMDFLGPNWKIQSDRVVDIFQHFPETWPEEVAKLIKA